MLVNQTLRRALATSTALALVVAAGPACALGLGQIQVKSRPGQPLLAEIPIVSSDPAELQGLQVQLASPDTFRRIGLEPPQGDVSALQFEPALDERGRPIIRITSPAPVQQPLLTFLVEVDWGGGRLVREYSALVDTPRTVAAPAQPPIQAPVVAAPNVVEPAAAPAVASEPAPTPAPAVPAPQPTAPQPTAPAPVATPVPEQAGSAPAPAPRPLPAPAPSSSEPHVATAPAAPRHSAAPKSAPTAGSVQVRSGDTLAGIAGRLDEGQGSLDQAMLALLRANPEAFVQGNINRLKAGAVLRTPTADELSRISASEASALVHEQIAGWRQARAPVAQPAAATTASAARPTPARPAPAVATRDVARLEIVPPAPGRARQAGSKSGLEAGGEGDMLRQQLQETKETLAARDAEVQELKTRVAELEKIQQDQQQLLQMKNSALAAAQQNLAKSNAAAATPAQPVVQAQAHAQPAPPAESHAAGPWLWSGIGLVLLAVVGWWFTRRRDPAPTTARRFDAASLAASVPVAEEPTVADYVAAARHEPAPPKVTVEAAHPATPPSSRNAPSWVGPGGAATTSAPETSQLIEDDMPRSAAEQLDLAQAYLDVGDDEAARTLLREVLDGRDPAARDAAARLLREL
jgi:pilus assembly protein FimV